jgi:clan AA aspartic protease
LRETVCHYVRVLGAADGNYEADFLVDTAATGCIAPADRLTQVGVKPVGTMVFELADGTKHEYPFGLVEIKFMGEITAGRVVFGPSDAEPVLGVTALESVGITVDPANCTLKRLPAIPLKGLVTKDPPRLPNPDLPRGHSNGSCTPIASAVRGWESSGVGTAAKA